jgi:hypothetical protein
MWAASGKSSPTVIKLGIPSTTGSETVVFRLPISTKKGASRASLLRICTKHHPSSTTTQEKALANKYLTNLGRRETSRAARKAIQRAKGARELDLQ